jgi:outer membrane protein OmpA-like peptidoglycan-associated protein/Tol biopolymer transport system component
MKYFYLTILLLTIFLSPVMTVAQSTKAKGLYDIGKKNYDDSKYPEAIKILTEAVKADAKYQDALYYLAGAYFYNENYDEAMEILKKLDAVNPDYWPYSYYWWGECYFYKNDLDNMKKKFEIFLQKEPKKPKNEKDIHKAKYKIRYANESTAIRKKGPTMDQPVNLGSVNSEFNDYMPQSNPTGKIIYFTSTRKGSPFNSDSYDRDFQWGEDIYLMEKTANGWTDPKTLPAPINSKNNDGCASFSGDGQTMVYSACSRDEGIGSCDLYISTLVGSEWSEPKNMGNVVNSSDWDAQPALSADGSMIIFASNRTGGYGGEDLYMITKNVFGEWGVPSNLGPVINTPSSENAPFFGADGKTLYFSSNGHPGFGGYDIFVSTFMDGKWTPPRNLGSPLNSDKDDKYFTIGGNGEVGYFASSREGGKGMYDLYSIKIPESMRPQPTVVVSGIVSNAKDNKPVQSWVMVEDLETGDLIATNKSNSVTGKYLAVLPSGRNYSVSANKEGFFFYSAKFEVPSGSKYQELTLNIPLKPLEKGAKVILNNIFFETGKATLTPESKGELNRAVELLKTNPTMKIEISGYTDNVGSAASNMTLSQNRATSVLNYLVTGGIDASRLTPKGYGPNQPIASNDTPEGRQANRRTEFLILDY